MQWRNDPGADPLLWVQPCSYLAYRLMMDCWHPEPSQRLDYTTIQQRLDAIVQDPVPVPASQTDLAELASMYLCDYIEIGEPVCQRAHLHNATAD